MNQSARILFCNCTYAQVVPLQVRQQVLRKLNASGVAFHAVADLCEMSARKDPTMHEIAGRGQVRIAACFPRAVKWLFHAAGAPLADERTVVLNMREQSAEQVLAALLAGLPDRSGLDADAVVGRVEPIREQLGLPKPGSWRAWFPVVDYDRCDNCKQCLSFCLFGVFGVNADDKVEVRNPDQCKTGCPACSRVCPTVAIMFPKYETGPVNGDEVGAEHLRGDGVKVDVSALLGGDIHAALRARTRTARQRFSVSRSQSGEEVFSPRAKPRSSE